jgi:hypothetical protein
MPNRTIDSRYLDALTRGFSFALELACTCGPLHVLVGVSEGTGPAADALAGAAGVPLRAVVTTARDILGEGASYLHTQAQESARSFAESRGEHLGVEHLLVVIIDQGTPEVLAALRSAGIDPAGARRAGLEALGGPVDLPTIALAALTAAGTIDRPPLPITDLDPQAWTALRWRQEHLPLSRLRRRSDWGALYHLESRAARQVAAKLSLSQDQYYSLIQLHTDAVRQRAASAKPHLVELRDRLGPIGQPLAVGAQPKRGRPPLIRSLTIGWGTWFKNRYVDIHDRWFRLRTMHYYRGEPPLSP